MIDILVVEPNELPYVKRIPNTLEAKQEIVGGYIERVENLQNDDTCYICNEEGKYLGLEPNRDIGYDILYGSFFVVGDNPNSEDFTSLTEEQIMKYQNKFDEKSIKKTKNKIEKKLKNISKDYEI